jgi:hypothetical protein
MSYRAWSSPWNDREEIVLKIKFIMSIFLVSGIIGLIAGLSGCSGSTPSTSISSSTSSTASTTIPPTSPVSNQSSVTVASQSNLSLTLTLSATNLQYGDLLSISIEGKNTLTKENQIAAADAWPLPSLSLGPCGTLNYPFGIAILPGNYDSGTLAQGTPLKLNDPNAVYNCPIIFAGITAYNFKASSNIADIEVGASTVSTEQMILPLTAAGFWTGTTQTIFHNFTPGIYTVVAGDEWGAEAVLHFNVAASTQPIAVTAVTGPRSPINPGGPNIEITLQNVSSLPVISLTATLELNRSFNFNFDVSTASPLAPTASINSTLTLIGAAFSSSLVYPLTVQGTFQDGSNFSFTRQVTINSPP